jgi:hypothetical protein
LTSARTTLTIKDYRVLFDRPDFPSSGASCVFHNGRLSMVCQKASDADAGLRPVLSSSMDEGRTWTEPEPFGPTLEHPETDFLGVSLAHATNDGTLVTCGVHIPGFGRDGIVWRPCDVLVGRRPPPNPDFEWQRFPSGTFLAEQFVAPGIRTRSGRLAFTIWGAGEQGQNPQCGVLLSDDGGQSLRYRKVGYEPDVRIRRDPDTPAGYNEQTLFETPGGSLVSIIRGRHALGAVPGSSPKCTEVLFSRSESTDGGETWSPPELTNLPGTGAPSDGWTLPDGSLLLPARVPTVWTRHDGYSLFGLHLARSFDDGQTWETELVLHRDPAGEPFDNYYNIMNGQFVRLDERRALYVFGCSQKRQNRHRVLCAELCWD